MTKNHYEILGVARDATDQQIRNQYTRRINEFRSSVASGARIDPGQLDALRTAYKILSDQLQRTKYDRSLPSTSSASHDNSQEERLVRRLLGGRVKAWKVFLLAFLIPGIIVEIVRYVLIGDLAKLVSFVDSHPLGFVYVVALAPGLVWFFGCYLIWRSSLNQRFRWLGYLTRVGSVLFTLFMLLSTVGLTYSYHALFLAPGNIARSPLGTGQSVPTGLVSTACKREIERVATPSAKLLVAARCGDLDEVKRLIGAGVEVDARETARGNVGRTPLHYAAGEGHVAVAEYLLSKGADPNAAADTGYTPLHVASGRGKTDTVALLLKKNANPNALDIRGGPLHAAVLQGNLEIVNLLLDANADPNLKREPDAATPLHVFAEIAIFYPKHATIIESLIKRGADINVLNSNGKTPLDSAEREASAYLIVQGARLSKDDPFALLWKAGRSGKKEPLEYLEKQGLSLKTISNDGNTLIHAAVSYGLQDTSALDFLISRGVDVNAARKNGMTPLHDAASACNQNGVKALLAKGANNKLKTTAGRTPLHAIFEVHVYWDTCKTVIHALLDSGADANIVDEQGQTPLHVVSDEGDLRDRFIKLGVDPRAKNQKGETALHSMLMYAKQPEFVDALVKAGANPNEQDNGGRTPLHVLSAMSITMGELLRLPMAVALVRNGARLDIRDKAGKTPLEVRTESQWGTREDPDEIKFRQLLKGR